MSALRSGVLAAGLLAGCGASLSPVSMTEKVTPTGQAGTGTIESIVPAPEIAAAGGTAGSGTKRIVVRMADGTLQSFETRAVYLKVGERVEIQPGGYIRHPAR
jgi:hypothetical protein